MAEPARELELTVEEYLRLEETARVKSEYVDGHVRAMAGASDEHNGIAVNLVLALGPAARARGCRVYASDMKLRTSAGRFYYPDVMVVCEPEGDRFYKTRPCLVFEVLSPSTEKEDRIEKLAAYLKLEALELYVLVDQDSRRIETYTREGDRWVYRVLEGGGELELPCLGGRLGLDEVYAGL